MTTQQLLSPKDRALNFVDAYKSTVLAEKVVSEILFILTFDTNRMTDDIAALIDYYLEVKKEFNNI